MREHQAMREDASFAEFLGRIRAGDEQAAAELVRRYEPAIRTEIRMRFNDPRMRRVVDSMDVCQSVLGSFFLRAASGQYDLERPEQLVRLLVIIARNKVIYQVRRQRAGIRDLRRDVPVDDAGGVAGDSPSPSRVAAGRELLDAVQQRLSEEERRLVELRGAGHSWAGIAAQLGGTPQARRKQLERALDRVAEAIDPEGAFDE
jgi:RNA polymerase sigma-70 factor (ECF subfamily)